MGGRNTSSGRTPSPAPVDLTKMDDAKLASFVQQAMNAKLPPGFHDDITQRMILAADWNGTPEVVPASRVESDANKKDAVALYRTVNYSDYHKIPSAKVADAFRTDSVFNTGGWGGQDHGGGVYFSDKLDGSKEYGKHKNGNAPSTIGAVLNSKAKVIDALSLRGTEGRAWIMQHTAAAKAMGFSIDKRRKNPISARAHRDGSYTVLAMAMGYNVVSSQVGGGERYYTILDRSVLTTSRKDYYMQSDGMK